jgi:hypothetical protein
MQTKPKARKPRRRDPVQAIGAAFARSLSFETVRAATLSYDEVTKSLREIETRYVAQLRGHPGYVKEVKRAIAGKLLEQAIFHGCKLSVCRARLSAASRLGFTDLEQSAHYRLLYAKGAFARGHKRVAYRTTKAVARDLERSLRRRKSLLGKHLLKLTREYLDHIRKSESAGEPAQSAASSGAR